MILGLFLGVSLGAASFSQVASAASYQKLDGTIVDPIQNRDFRETVHPYSGPNLAPGAILAGANLVFSNLSRANLVGADLAGANLAGSNLAGADLSGANLTGTSLFQAWYDATTVFPVGFDPIGAGMRTPIVINNGLAPPNPQNVVYWWSTGREHFIVNNAGCNAALEYPCSSPGAPTVVNGVVRNLDVFDTSTFVGGVYEEDDVIAHDSSNVVITGGQRADLIARDSSTLTDEGCSYCTIQASGSSTVYADGFYEGGGAVVSAGGDAYLYFSGSVEQGDGVSVGGNALLEFVGGASWLNVVGGRAILRGHVDWGGRVYPEGVLEMTGGRIFDSGSSPALGFLVNGQMFMSAGSLNESELLVDGYASITGGNIHAAPVPAGNRNGFVFTPGPWNFFGLDDGLIELSGGTLNEFVSIGPRDSSRIRIFGSNFAVDTVPVGFGALPSASGRLSGTLPSGDAIDNPFGHRGANCGEQACSGRVLVLAPGLDWDQDAVPNPFDNCAEEPNLDQTDADTDGTGDVCFAPVDLDRDGVVDALDNCRVDANGDQVDADSDGVGDACDDSLVVWTDPGTSGCTIPPQPSPYTPMTSDLANSDIIDRAAQPCDCMGMELPATPGVASVRFLHLSPTGVVKEVCENVAPYAFGLAPGQPLCSTSLAQNGVHSIMVTPYDAPGCEAGVGDAMGSSIRRFSVVPEPGTALMLGTGVIGLAARGRRSARPKPSRNRPDA